MPAELMVLVVPVMPLAALAPPTWSTPKAATTKERTARPLIASSRVRLWIRMDRCTSSIWSKRPGPSQVAITATPVWPRDAHRQGIVCLLVHSLLHRTRRWGAASRIALLLVDCAVRHPPPPRVLLSPRDERSQCYRETERLASTTIEITHNCWQASHNDSAIMRNQ
jgi:hypothetical protein